MIRRFWIIHLISGLVAQTINIFSFLWLYLISIHINKKQPCLILSFILVFDVEALPDLCEENPGGGHVPGELQLTESRETQQTRDWGRWSNCKANKVDNILKKLSSHFKQLLIMGGKQAWQHPLDVKLLDMKVEVEPIRCRNKSLKIENKDVAGGRFGGQDIGLTESTQIFLVIRYSNKKFIKDAKRFWYIVYFKGTRITRAVTEPCHSF